MGASQGCRKKTRSGMVKKMEREKRKETQQPSWLFEVDVGDDG